MRFLIYLLTFCIGMQLQAREFKDLRSFGDISVSTLYLFTSPSCPHCRVFHKSIFPELIRKYVKTKKAQIVIVDMPYDPITMNAVMIMRCLPEEKATKMMGWLYENQSKWLSNKDPDFVLKQYAQVLGMYATDFQACLQDNNLKEAIEQQRDNMSSLYNVHGWPTVALRQGHTVQLYAGTDKRMILSNLDKEIKQFQDDLKKRTSQSKKQHDD
ncbi:MAG: thioredoxin domain-containing protein [Alphaproteobacteria bacterium]|nr:thioredoxin domain-containing protein [Alphaproteobacteria bacterium]